MEHQAYKSCVYIELIIQLTLHQDLHTGHFYGRIEDQNI